MLALVFAERRKRREKYINNGTRKKARRVHTIVFENVHSIGECPRAWLMAKTLLYHHRANCARLKINLAVFTYIYDVSTSRDVLNQFLFSSMLHTHTFGCSAFAVPGLRSSCSHLLMYEYVANFVWNSSDVHVTGAAANKKWNEKNVELATGWLVFFVSLLHVCVTVKKIRYFLRSFLLRTRQGYKDWLVDGGFERSSR